jgi:hypothetical protein
MTTIEALPAEYTELTERLESAGGRYRFVQAARGLGGFVALVVPVAVGVLLVAGVFSPGAWVNGLLITMMVAAAAIGYAAFLHTPLFRRPTFGEIARVVEQEGNELDNALINAVLLAQDLDGGSVNGSAEWIPHALKETSSALAGVELERRMPWRIAGRAWVLAGALLLVCAIVAGVFRGTVAHGFWVLTSPTRFVPRQGIIKIVNVSPGNDTALAGQSVLFSVTVESPEHKTVPVSVEVRYASGRKATMPLAAFGADNSQYTRQEIVALENPKADREEIAYLVTAGDTQSEWYHITVLPQIKLTKYEVAMVPPPYTGREKQVVTLTGKDLVSAKTAVEVAAGSQVTVFAALDGPSKEVLIDLPGTQPVGMNFDAGKNGYTATMVLKESLRFAIRVNDGSNRTLAQFPEKREGGDDFFSLNAVPDVMPTVLVTEPGRDMDARPGDKVQMEAQATDDYGLALMRLEMAKNSEREFKTVQSWPVAAGKDGKPARAATVRYTLELAAEQYKFGDTVRYRFVSVDNRDLKAIDPALGPQTTHGQIFTLSFNDKAATAVASTKLWEELRLKLMAILEKQVVLRKDAQALVTGVTLEDMRKIDGGISTGQKGVKADLEAVAKDFPFDASMKLVQKSLQVLAVEDGASAVDRSADILLLSDAKSLPPLASKLRQHQSRIIDVLQTLLAIVASNEEKLARISNHEGGDIPTDARDAWKKLSADLKEFEKQQQAVIDTTQSLAKKPKDQFDANDQQKLKDLAVQEEKWEKYMNQKIADMSKLTEQNPTDQSLLEEMVQMKVELATAKDALQQKAVEIATPLEENGLEDAKQLDTHIERWLQQQPDRQAWQMEEPVTQSDPSMAELPKQLQDMVGELMDKEEDLTQEMESVASKNNDSLNKGAGWDAADGPISNMSAQGVTGNQMPKDMEIQGRSGEGREGRSSGEMVGSTAEGKEGRTTPPRMTNEAFSSGQVEDKSKLPAGNATGGGKKGAMGGEGMEGQAPPEDPNNQQRLAGKQAAIRNEAERLSLQMNAAGFDNFKLVEANAYLKKSEDAMKQNHYETALYYQEQAVQSLNTAKVLASGQVHVIADTSPTASERTQKEIDSALNGPMPRGYGDPVKAYFEKMAGQ